MQTLLQQRISRLDRFSAYLMLAITAVWVGLVAYYPLNSWDTVASAAVKCALVVALVVVGKFAVRLTPWIKTLCLFTAFVIAFLTNPDKQDVPDAAGNMIGVFLVVFFALAMAIDARRAKLTRHSDTRFN